MKQIRKNPKTKIQKSKLLESILLVVKLFKNHHIRQKPQNNSSYVVVPTYKTPYLFLIPPTIIGGYKICARGYVSFMSLQPMPIVNVTLLSH